MVHLKFPELSMHNKIIFFVYLILAITVISVIFHMNSFYSISHQKPGESIVNTHFIRILDVNRTKLFDTISKLKEYPSILPKDIESVKIINSTGDITYAELIINEKGFRVESVVKQTILPYEGQSLEFLSGDLNSSTIWAHFEEINGSKTRISMYVNARLHGFLQPVSLISQEIMEQKIDDILTKFLDYGNFENKYEAYVDELYREILHRPADSLGLTYWGDLLKSGKMTEEEVRDAIIKSPEAKSMNTTHIS